MIEASLPDPKELQKSATRPAKQINRRKFLQLAGAGTVVAAGAVIEHTIPGTFKNAAEVAAYQLEVAEIDQKIAEIEVVDREKISRILQEQYGVDLASVEQLGFLVKAYIEDPTAPYIAVVGQVHEHPNISSESLPEAIISLINKSQGNIYKLLTNILTQKSNLTELFVEGKEAGYDDISPSILSNDIKRFKQYLKDDNLEKILEKYLQEATAYAQNGSSDSHSFKTYFIGIKPILEQALHKAELQENTELADRYKEVIQNGNNFFWHENSDEDFNNFPAAKRLHLLHNLSLIGIEKPGHSAEVFSEKNTSGLSKIIKNLFSGWNDFHQREMRGIEIVAKSNAVAKKAPAIVIMGAAHDFSREIAEHNLKNTTQKLNLIALIDQAAVETVIQIAKDLQP